MARRQLRRIDLQPDEGAVGWIHAYARRNFWRVSSWYELKDLVQDGYLHYYRCVDRYSAVVENRRHFMALFKRVYSVHIITLSNHRTQLTEVPFASMAVAVDGQDTEYRVEEVLGAVSESATGWVLIREAPKEIRAVLSLFSMDSMLSRVCQPHKSDGTVRETTNEWLCRLCGYDPTKINLRGQVEAYLSP